MNRVFKNKWSAAHQQYVVTDEHRSTKGKASKSAVALAVAAVAMMAAGGASAAYIDPGYEATSWQDFEAAKASWETDEYKADWGLTAMNSSTAYALGYTGAGVHVGVMDSGALLEKHPDLAGTRFHAVKVDDLAYGISGNRYPQNTGTTSSTGAFTPESEVPADGNWDQKFNDSHGTHVTGTVGANRDGSEFHGVAFGADVHVANTGGNDNTNYGPFQDPKFFYMTWNQAAKDVNEANEGRGGFINNSFGTNTRIVDQKTTGPDGGSTGVHLPVDTIQQVEYEYFLFKKYAPSMTGQALGWDEDASTKYDFVDAAYKAAKDNNVVQVFTTGNRDFKNPFYRPLYPYFNPEAEQNWIAVAGMKRGTEAGTYTLYSTFNEAGLAKWWTVAAPGESIYGSKVNTTTGEATWGNSSGTSMAAPHVTGALAVLMQRYDQMDATQVRDVMLTTASHRNPDGSIFDGWTAKEGQVDERYGWGMPDLEKGMYGPGQLLGKFEYEMAAGSFDVWSNDIGAEALKQRKAEEEAWVKSVTTELGAVDPELVGDYELGESVEVVGLEDDSITEEEAKQWRTAYLQKRVDAINARLTTGDKYQGSIVKKGEGTLVMTGSNSYEGTTTVEAGTLLAFAESVGTDDTVTVSGGTFGVLGGYYDDFTMTGYKQSSEAQAGKLTIDLSSGDGTLHVSAAADVKVKEVKLGTGKKVSIGLEGADAAQLAKAYQNDEEVAGTFSVAEGTLEGATIADATLESVFFEKASGKLSTDNKSITTTVTRKADVGFESFATTDNERAIARALEQSGNAFAGTVLSLGTEEEVNATYAALSDDMYAAARNALVVNATAVSRTVMDQARGFGEGRSAELEQGRGRIWATGIGFWGDAEGESHGLDVDFRAGLLGGEVVAHETTKLGAFFGYGSTDYKGRFGKIDGDDLHFGVYGLTDVGPVSFAYGVAYTTEDRDSSHVLGTTANSHDEDATVLQAYAEAAYRFDVAGAKIDPYLGLTWARVEVDGFSEAMSGESFAVKDQKDDIQIATLGARATLPLTWGTMPVALKADLGWSHYFGDTEAVTRMQLGAGGAIAELQAKELKDQVSLGLGITGQVSQNATVGVSYTGSFGTDADTHGLTATFRYAF